MQNNTILSAARAMCLVCCWVILFRTVITFLKVWVFKLFPALVQVLLSGTLELTNGCFELPEIKNVDHRFILCSCMLSFGGICVLLQTSSVTKGLSLRSYVKGKLLQMLFSFILSWGFVTEYGLVILISVVGLTIILRKIQNRCGNSLTLPV